MSEDIATATDVELSPTVTLPVPVLKARTPLRAFSVDDVSAMADNVARSGLFPGVTSPAAAFSLMMLCQSEGLHPMQALKRYHIIEGRPTLRADAMQAEFQRQGGRIQWVEFSRTAARAVFSHPEFCPDGVDLAVTFEEFARTGMVNGKYGVKDNWKHHPDSMLRARLISKGIRMVHPGIVAGIYTPEEALDFTPVPPLPAPPPARPNNNSGSKTGQYASDEQVAAFRHATMDFCAAKNAGWLDEWTRDGGLVEGIGDLLHPVQVVRHLLKWGLRTGRLAEVPMTFDAETGKPVERVSVEQAKKYVAIVYAREPEAVADEAEEYFRERAAEARLRWRDDHPDGSDEAGTSAREPGDDDE